ncbi:MAG: 3-oxoacyl-ACP synthase [Bacteroidales bacterium]|nr:3-oxoacyl-ACP synthase [Bacteroidales bacterium]
MKRIRVTGDSIISPLGTGSEENFLAVLGGKTALSRHEGTFGLPEPFFASLFGEEVSRDESLLVRCASDAMERAGIDPSAADVMFFFSSVKGDVDRLLYEPAENVRKHFGNPNPAVTVSNACTSGVCALVQAMRALRAGKCSKAVVVGYEFLSKFIISGFQSFKALSPEACRPFDRDRVGLNLGEAVAAMVLEAVDATTENDWELVRGAIRNDANHISGPSRTGEGSYNCLRGVLSSGIAPEEIAFLNVHGTATPYNDEMESIAIDRAGLIGVPVNALKGYFGHTMGAAGILETILSMRAVDKGLVLGVRGFENLGVSRPVNISSAKRETGKKAFVKLLSGFGGINAALLCAKGGNSYLPEDPFEGSLELEAEARVDSSEGPLGDLYRALGDPYPKFFKMDPLSKLGYIAVERLLSKTGRSFELREDRAVILFSTKGCVCDDNNYKKTIEDSSEYFPSPALFVYTLPNIVGGEISIRNLYKGETSAYVVPERDEDMIMETVREAFSDPETASAIVGWVECASETDFTAQVKLIKRKF